VLPLVPAYLGYLTGATLEGAVPVQSVTVQSTAGGVAVATAPPPTERVPSPFLHSVAFVAGFSAIFILFGISIGLIGWVLKDNQDIILKVSGTLLIIMGLHLAGVITIPFLEQERRLDVGGNQRVGYARSFLVGCTFSAGWSPCIGPTLGAIFALAIAGGTVAEGGLLLGIYSLGLAIPFLAMGLAYSGIKPVYNWIKPYVWIVNYISGALLIIIGILIFTDSLVNLNSTFDFWPFSELAELETEIED